MGGKIQKEFNLSELLLRYILTDPSGLFLRLASQLFMSHPLLLKSVKDTQHLYKSKLTSFSNLHSAFSPGTREAGNVLWYVSRLELSFHSSTVCMSTLLTGRNQMSPNSPREYLWASQPKPKILLSETRFLLRGHCSSLRLHTDKRRILSVKSTDSRHHMSHVTCEWLSSHVFAYHHHQQQQDNSWLCLCAHPICVFSYHELPNDMVVMDTSWIANYLDCLDQCLSRHIGQRTAPSTQLTKICSKDVLLTCQVCSMPNWQIVNEILGSCFTLFLRLRAHMGCKITQLIKESDEPYTVSWSAIDKFVMFCIAESF